MRRLRQRLRQGVSSHVGRTTYTLDSFEGAIHKLAPLCAHCGCRVIGHGVEAQGRHLLLCQLRANDRDARGGRSGLNAAGGYKHDGDTWRMAVSQTLHPPRRSALRSRRERTRGFSMPRVPACLANPAGLRAAAVQAGTAGSSGPARTASRATAPARSFASKGGWSTAAAGLLAGHVRVGALEARSS